MGRHGFDPEVRRVRGRTEIVLRNCPFETTALVDRETVCALHLGLAEGMVDGTDAQVDELVAFDPRRAGCRLRLRERDDAAPDGTEAADRDASRPGEGAGELTLRR